MKQAWERKLERYQKAMFVRQLMTAAGVSGNADWEHQWEWMLSPLGNGRHAERFQELILSGLVPRVLAAQWQESSARIPADVPEDFALVLGFDELSDRKLAIHQDEVTKHIMIHGKSGSGKTTLIAWLIGSLLARGIRVTHEDHKDDGRRLIHLYPSTAVFQIGQEPCNLLEPVGVPEVYYLALFSEWGKTLNVHTETWMELVELMKRIARGLRADDPYPSLKDLERILFAVAKKDNRSKMLTAARALHTFNALLGRAAYVRKAPDVKDRYSLVVFEYQNLPPRICRFLAAMRLLRKQMRAIAEGHKNHLQELFVYDEAAMVFGREFSGETGSNYVNPHKRGAMQIRSFGVGIIAGVQMLSNVDESLLANCSTFYSLGTPDWREAREAQRRLGLPENAAEEIMTLVPGQLFVRSTGFQRAVRGWFPEVELGDYISDADLATHMKPELEWLEQNTVYAPIEDDDVAPLSYQEILREKIEVEPEHSADEKDATISHAEIQQRFFDEHREFLREIKSHPSASVSEHYRNLGWSFSRANRVRNDLLAMGLVRPERQKSLNGRPKEILIITEKGRELLHEP